MSRFLDRLLINASLGGSPNIGWVATAWTLGSSIGFLLVGRLSDIFGRRYIVLGGGVLSLIGCIIGATAQSVETLIAASVFNGIAAAQQLSFGIFLGELVPNRLRGPVIGGVFLSAVPFSVFGPSIARAFITNTAAGWRWSFYMSIIFAAIALVLAFFFYHPPSYAQLHIGGKSKAQQVKELDYIGITLFVSGCVLFLVGLSWGGVAYPWVSGHVLGTLISGIVTLIIFAVYGEYPTLPITSIKKLFLQYRCLRSCVFYRNLFLQGLALDAPASFQKRRLCRHLRGCFHCRHGIL